MPINLFFHDPVNRALEFLGEKIDRPDFENPKEFYGFEFIALWNTYAAIANAISEAGHGGMIVIIRDDVDIDDDIVRIKYSMKSNVLRDAFIGFLNARHVIGDALEIIEEGHNFPEDASLKAELDLRDAYDGLIEATRLVAGFSGCDGAIVMTESLEVIGFGAEIRADIKPGVRVFEVHKDYSDERLECDIEQFGMRHRSAVKIASCSDGILAIAVSQDGPISAILNKKDEVLVRKNVKLTNMNMPWA